MLSQEYHKTEAGIWTREDDSVFLYSDGDEVENRLLRQLREAKDVSLASDELQRLMIDWPSEYHFSPLRANLLSPFKLERFSRILEIGSGCGAITRLLGERCPDSAVLALEGSERRAAITRERCRELDNVEVCRDSFTEFNESADSFDLITLIGVLEYSPSFFKTDKPILAALEKCRSLLDRNGVLVVAIENQLGLKYFNGCAEDHNGQLFSGLNDQYAKETVRTFGRNHLQEKIIQAGFTRVEFVYPFPDYKLPQVLLKEEAFSRDSFNPGYLIGQYPARDYSRSTGRIFQESRVWNLLARNGMIQNLANSFLVFAFNGNGELDQLAESWFAKSFSGKRKKHYLVQNDFLCTNGAITVNKSLCYPETSASENRDQKLIIHHFGPSEFYPGVPYTYQLLEIDREEEFLANYISYLKSWVDWLRTQSIHSEQKNQDGVPLVPGKYYDCMPANFIINTDDGALQIIDQEWEHQADLDFGFVVFRGLYREITSNLDFFEQSGVLSDCSILDMITKIFIAFAIPFNKEIYKRYLDIEINVQLELIPYNTDSFGLKENLNEFFTKKRHKKLNVIDLMAPSHMLYHEYLIQREIELDQKAWDRGKQLEERDLHISDIERSLSKIQTELAENETELEKMTFRVLERNETLRQVYQSSSWKVTAPLRLGGYLVKGDFKKVADSIRHARASLSRSVRSFTDRILKFTNKYQHLESRQNIKAIEAIIECRNEITRSAIQVDHLSAVAPDKLPAIDINAVTFNSARWIEGFAKSLLGLDYPKDLLTVIFVDNGSTDATAIELDKAAEDLRAAGCSVSIHHRKNKGYGAGHNYAIKQGSAQYCLITNVDLVFDPMSLAHIVATAVADEPVATAWELKQRPYEHPKFYDPVTGLTNWNSHACVLFKRSVLEEVGGYDETLFMYGEDVELSYRLRRAGALLRYCPRAVVEHFSYDHAGEIKPMQYKGSTFANLYLRLKYGTIGDICAIPIMAIQLMLSPTPFSGARNITIGNLFRLLLVAPKALFLRKSSDEQVYFPFRTWDYELARDGAFIEQLPLPEKLPLVSVITRTYQGREQFLRQAMLSVAHQSYTNIEHIIVQDGGDSLNNVVNEIDAQTGIKTIFKSIEKLGRSVAGNMGLEKANGKYCLFLDDDDLLFGDHVELLVGALAAEPGSVAAYSFAWEVPTDVSCLSEGRYMEVDYQIPAVLQEEYDYETLKHHNLMAIQSIMFERELFEKRGGFDEDLEVLEDWILWLCYGYENNIIQIQKVTSLFRTPVDQKLRNARQEIIDTGYQPAVERAKQRIEGFIDGGCSV